MTRRRLLALVCFSAPLLGIAVACTFPSVDYTPVTGLDTGADSSASSDARFDASEDSDVGELSDAAPADLTACHTCDCDGDGYWRDAGCDAAATDAATRLGFGDCDDSRVDYHPGQTKYFTSYADGSALRYDYNCDGQENLLFPVTTACTGLVATGCTPSTGFFQSPVPCGAEGDFSTCVGGGALNLACTAQPNGNKQTEACR